MCCGSACRGVVDQPVEVLWISLYMCCGSVCRGVVDKYVDVLWISLYRCCGSVCEVLGQSVEVL